ncbi:aspartate aminotransferase family protein [Streptomyces sp. NPDC090106]|uniref:aspartate aminotransferase family protein n=1 Tax=Streptomyces sp. NPDC090106 TaxID=3365946 RepID=UPI0037F48712
MPIPQSDRGRRIYDDDRRYVFHSWSAQAGLDPLVITDAEGVRVEDADGRSYLDFSSQLVYTNLGHRHPAVVEAIRRQAAELATIAPAHANEARSQAARLIIERAPASMEKVFFTNGGAEAVENAIRMARLYTGRYKVLSQYRSYHGSTAMAINTTGDHRRWANDYGTSGAVHFFGPFLYRSVFHARDEKEECERALAHLEQVIAFEGPQAFAAIVLETVPGTAGVMPPPAGYLRGVRELCDRYGIVLVLDEVMVGFGRTGTWFASEHYDVEPDLMTFAKGVNSGYVPLGGVLLNGPVAHFFDDRPYPGGMTYSGHPLACAAAVATIRTMAEEDVPRQAADLGRQVLGPGLAELAQRHPSIGEVRGLGAFWALDLVSDRETREPIAPYGGSSEAVTRTLAAGREAGLLLFNQYHRIHLAPPLTMSAEDAREGLRLLDGVLDVTDAYTTAARV